MPREPTREITEALRRWWEGEGGPAGEIIPLVEAELRTIARSRLRSIRRPREWTTARAWHHRARAGEEA